MDSPRLWNWKLFSTVLALIGVCLLPCTQGWTSAGETALRSALESGYEDDVRPIENTEIFLSFQMTTIDSVIKFVNWQIQNRHFQFKFVAVHLKFVSIGDVTKDIKSQTFGVSGWWVFQWTDDRLVWDPSTNENIPVLQYLSDDLWTPAFVISNSVTDLSAIVEPTVPVRVTYQGAVQWQPPGIFKSGCSMDTTYFPFDTQTCSMQVTSFGYTNEEVSMNTTKGVLMDFYTPSGDWDILEQYKDIDVYADGSDQYSRITFSVKLKRLNTYHWLNIILPVVISGVLVIFVFLLPVPSGEKMGYSLTCLLTYVVLLTLIAADMPTTAKHVSVLEVYLTISLLLSGFTVGCSIISIHLYETPEDARIPGWIILMVKKLWPLVDWRKDTGSDTSTKDGGKDGRVHPEGDRKRVKNDAATAFTLNDFVQNNKGLRTPVRRLSLESTGSSEDKYREELVNGQVCSMVMDKILFRLFVVLIPVFTLVFLLVLAVGGKAAE